MRTARRDGRRLLSEHDGRGALEVIQAPAVALALQRTAGNAAVARWLARQREKDTLIDTTDVSVGNVKGFFQGHTRAREGMDVTVRFGAGIEDAVHDGLTNLTLAMLRLDAAAQGKPMVDMVHFQNLDLSDVGGSDGRYRFTSVVTKNGRHGPEAVDVLVELLGARKAAFTPWDKLTSKRKLELENRYAGFGFTRASPSLRDSEPVDEWTPEQFGRVLQALEQVPETALKGVPGIVWARGHGQKGPSGEAGEYTHQTGLTSGDTPVRRLTIYDGAFGTDEWLTQVVAHEIGHGISFKPAETGGKALAMTPQYQAAAKADSPFAITEYGKKSWHEHYAEAYSMFLTEPATLQILRPKTYEYFAKAR